MRHVVHTQTANSCAAMLNLTLSILVLVILLNDYTCYSTLSFSVPELVKIDVFNQLQLVKNRCFLPASNG